MEIGMISNGTKGTAYERTDFTNWGLDNLTKTAELFAGEVGTLEGDEFQRILRNANDMARAYG